MKAILKNLLTETQRQSIRRKQNSFLVFREYFYDARRFLRFSSAVRDPRLRQQLAAHITMDYHRLEKGLSLLEPRIGFGKDVIERLLQNITIYTERFGPDDLTRTANGVLRSYQERQKKLGFSNATLDIYLAGTRQEDVRSDGECGVTTLELSALFPFDSQMADAFLRSRHSVRQFDGTLVSDDSIGKIAALAQRAPSVCNRQAGRLYFANRRNSIDLALSFQNGNRGFGHSIGAVFIVAVDIQAFTTLGERNQAFVDGGIFAMATLAAIHAQKLGGCMLNWSATSDRDKALRKAFGILDSEVVITMIGCGVPVERPAVAVSPRIAPDAVLRRL